MKKKIFIRWFFSWRHFRRMLFVLACLIALVILFYAEEDFRGWQIPHDVIGGKSLHYSRKDGGKFLLYSIGWNETDDGGQIG